MHCNLVYLIYGMRKIIRKNIFQIDKIHEISDFGMAFNKTMLCIDVENGVET